MAGRAAESKRNIAYSVRQIGDPHTVDYKAYIQRDGRAVSAFHDVPLKTIEEDYFNMIVEVPRWTNAKLEISAKEPLNPIVQDIKKGKLRYVANVFPFKGYIHNYGAFPQTWEDPSHKHPETGASGDSDPLDVCEIGQGVGYTGQIKQVKVLGCLAMIDEGETDWKILAIDKDDPLAAQINDIEDVEKYMPGLLTATRQWFKNYKVPDGNPTNQFAFNGEYRNKQFALGVVQECSESWKKLIASKENSHGINTAREGDVNVPQGIEITGPTHNIPAQEKVAFLGKL